MAELPISYYYQAPGGTEPGKLVVGASPNTPYGYSQIDLATAQNLLRNSTPYSDQNAYNQAYTTQGINKDTQGAFAKSGLVYSTLGGYKGTYQDLLNNQIAPSGMTAQGPGGTSYVPTSQIPQIQQEANQGFKLTPGTPLQYAPGQAPAGLDIHGMPTATPTYQNIPNPNPSNLPTTGITAPTLPPQTSTATTASYFQGLSQSVQSAQQNLDNARAQQLQQIQQDKQTAQTNFDSANASQNTAIQAEQTAKLDQLKLEEQRFNDNYNTVQGLTQQLMDMTQKGNDLIAQERGTTGLQSIRQPRIDQTINSIVASTGVLKAAIDGYNGQMSAARAQLVDTTNVLTSTYHDQIAYYQNLADFYGKGIVTATKEQSDFIQATVTELQNKVNTANSNLQALQNEFLDPTKALAFAEAGINILTPQDQWGPLLAIRAYAKEISTQSKDMADKGYSTLMPGTTPPKGADVISQTDSSGKITQYYKVPTALEVAQFKALGGTGTIDQTTVNNLVSAIRSGGAKLSDISDKNIKLAVENALGASGSSGTDDLISTTKQSLAELQSYVDTNHGFKAVVGSKLNWSTLGGFVPGGLPGSPAADFTAKLKQATQDVVLPNLKLLHGLGRVTDREFQSLQSAVTSLSPNLSEAEFKTELTSIINRVNAITNNTSSSIPKGTDGTSYGFPGYISDGTQWVKK